MAKRFKLATLLNVVGLIIAFALFYMLITQISFQITYNKGIENHERLYRLDNNYVYKKTWPYNDNVCQCFAEALRSLSEVESFALFENYSTSYKYKNRSGNNMEYNVIYCSPKAISTFCCHAVNGKIEWDDEDANDNSGLIIPASIAMEYFGTTHVVRDTIDSLGRTHEVRDSMYCIGMDTLGNERIIKQSVRGVYKDFPDNSEISNCIYRRMEESEKYLFNAQYRCYAKFAEVPDDTKSLEAKLKRSILDYINTNSNEFRGNVKNLDKELDIIKATNFRFTPLDDSYFQELTHTSGESGFDIMPKILRFACLFLIIIATINFLNFTLAESPTRVRGLNTRLALGAERRHLRWSIVAECIVLSVVTCLSGIILCNLLPLMHISNMPFTGDLSLPSHWGLALLTLGFAVVIGIVAGLYPAIFATSFAPAKVLKGSFGLTPQGHNLRAALVCVQLFISMLMTIYIGILFLQNHYIFNQPYGFDKDKLLYANLKYIKPADAEDLEHTLRQLPGIKGVSFAEVLLAGTDGHSEIQSTYRGQREMDYFFTHIDQDYMRTMGIKPIEGRDFSDDDSAAIIINEAARQQWPWLKLGDKISTDICDVEVDSVTVIGICQNIRYSTMLVNSNQPFGFILNRTDDDVIFTHLLVRVIDGTDMEDTRLRANVLLQEFFHDKDSKYTLTPYNNCVAASYETEMRFFRQMFIIGLSCIVITLIGLFCLTMFETEYRRKEIGIRKVAGAATGEIVWMLCRRYGLIILLCFAVAAPIAWYYGQETLKHFNDHASIHWWIFPLSLLLVGGIMLGAVALQSWLAARKNPSSTITTE